MNKKLGFTLAEVLITLAILGIVAALTIPAVVAKYQKKQYYTYFINAYNIISSAMNLSVVDNGTPDFWGLNEDSDDEVAVELIRKNILPYFKVSRKITEDDENFNYPVTSISGEKGYNDYYGKWNDFYSELNADDNVYLFSNGMVLDITMNTERVTFSFDTNGPKEPNIYGRDIFMLYYMEVDGKWMLTSDGLYKHEEIETMIAPGMYRHELGDRVSISKDESMQIFLHGDSLSSCNPDDINSYGVACGGRLLLDGKMDY